MHNFTFLSVVRHAYIGLIKAIRDFSVDCVYSVEEYKRRGLISHCFRLQGDDSIYYDAYCVNLNAPKRLYVNIAYSSMELHTCFVKLCKSNKLN